MARLASLLNVCTTSTASRKAMVRSIGADEVIDYTQDDFTQTGQHYDAMLDLVGTRSLSDCRRALAPRGTYVVVGVKNMGRWFGLGRQFKALLLSPLVPQRMRVFVVRHTGDDLAVLKELVEAGKLTPVIDKRYILSQVPEALRFQGEGHPRGKIVIVASSA
jgi:NADPH:quinone reductase-like Zn-dependent oxidoreductase